MTTHCADESDFVWRLSGLLLSIESSRRGSLVVGLCGTSVSDWDSMYGQRTLLTAGMLSECYEGCDGVVEQSQER